VISISLSSDGKRMAVGDPIYSDDAERVQVYQRKAALGKPMGQALVGEQPGTVGYSVAMSNEATECRWPSGRRLFDCDNLFSSSTNTTGTTGNGNSIHVPRLAMPPFVVNPSLFLVMAIVLPYSVQTVSGCRVRRDKLERFLVTFPPMVPTK
jgi:hypothetical protein